MLESPARLGAERSDLEQRRLNLGLERPSGTPKWLHTSLRLLFEKVGNKEM